MAKVKGKKTKSFDCMRLLKFDKGSEAADALRAGEVVMHATETCYGLAADIFNKSALEKLYKIKKMDESKPVSMMVSGLAEAQKYAEFNELALRLAERFWPGPLAIILPGKKILPDFFNAGSKTVGIRCPDSAVSQELISAFGGPLTTTSANISGLPEVYKVEDFLAQLQEGDLRPGVILDSGEIPKNAPSTIVAFDGGAFKLVREGALAEAVKEFLLV